MRFYFDIEDYEFDDEYGIDFKQAVINGAINAVAEQIFNDAINPDGFHSEVKKQIDNIIKSNHDKICEIVVERVADKIAKKRAIVELTPKAAEIAAVDKDNVAYFEEMIDRAIARKFGK